MAYLGHGISVMCKKQIIKIILEKGRSHKENQPGAGKCKKKIIIETYECKCGDC